MIVISVQVISVAVDIGLMTKYILVLLSMGAYAYVSNQTFEDELRAKESVQVQQTENLSQ